MRTTVSLEEDVAAAVQRLRRDEGIGLSEALNRIARKGLQSQRRPPVRLKTYRLGTRVDISNVVEALEAAEGTSWR